MAFFVHRQELARRTAHDEAMALIDAYLAWQDTAASMKEALLCLVALYGDPVKEPCRWMWRALRLEDEDARLWAMYAGLERIQRHLRRNPGVTAIWSE
jgi:hypothetical protein